MLGLVATVEVNDCRAGAAGGTSGEEVFRVKKVGVIFSQLLVLFMDPSDEFGWRLLTSNDDGRCNGAVERRGEAVCALELRCDGFDQGLLFVCARDTRACRLDRLKELSRREVLLMRKGDPKAELVVRLAQLIEQHRETVAPRGEYLTVLGLSADTTRMRTWISRMLPLPKGRVPRALSLLLLLVFTVAFTRNVISAVQATLEVNRLRDENAALQAQADALAAERVLLDDPAFLALIARGYSLGSTVERPFALAANAPALPDDAPGSAARRVTTGATPPSPIDVWLGVLFGS
ncbi:MAG: hypothetical protein RIT06_194 [Chloroflexota bacterium]